MMFFGLNHLLDEYHTCGTKKRSFGNTEPILFAPQLGKRIV